MSNLINKNQEAFLSLIRAGLWEKDSILPYYAEQDYNVIYNLAEQQSVVGLVAAGIEHISGLKIPQTDALKFIGTSIQLEQRNITMNDALCDIIHRLKENDILALLVKGQGIAQCYERPLWRSPGDIDLLLEENDYKQAKDVLIAQADYIEKENKYKKHLAIYIHNLCLELHGSFHTGLAANIDSALDIIQKDLYKRGDYRIWNNKGEAILLPNPTFDCIFIFTHILQHLFKGGIGLRQICDWCRLLWVYRCEIDRTFIEETIKKMGVLTEWKVFASLGVVFLGVPEKCIPLYDKGIKWSNKAKILLSFILNVGNFGHNKTNKGIVKVIYNRLNDFIRLFFIFPIDTIHFFYRVFFVGRKEYRESK